jgi:hypothetical protein
MIDVDVEIGVSHELTATMIRAQLELLVRDDVFRSSKRSVAFLKYVVEQTLNGSADQIKERTIGIEVFRRDPSYDTSLDHIVRTAATELRKRLASYYVDERHRSELRMDLVPGSYIPKFSLPSQGPHSLGTHSSGDNGTGAESTFGSTRTRGTHIRIGPVPLQNESIAERTIAHRNANRYRGIVLLAFVGLAAWVGYRWLSKASPQDLFWKPVLDTPGPVLLVVGNHPNGPPMPSQADGYESSPTPILSSDESQTVPFADAVTIARVVGVLEVRKKRVLIRKGNSSSFSDFREGAVVLIGAFNNEWSLRLTRQLRYSLALDAERHLIYIRDAKNPSSRSWSWATNQPHDHVAGANSPTLQDFALISRIRDSETGHVVVVIGGLYTYGTQAAGEFLTDPQLMQAIAKATQLNGTSQNLQIVLGTTVTDETPGPPRVLAVSPE